MPEADETSGALTAVAAEIREEWQQSLAGMGLTRRYGPRYDGDFGKAARQCLGLGMKPLAYVRMCLRRHETEKERLAPYMLHGRHIDGLYERWHESSRVAPATELSVQQSYWWAQKAMGRDEHDILMDDNIGLTSWFRVIAADGQFDDVREKYFEDAGKSLLNFPDLFDFIRGLDGVGEKVLNDLEWAVATIKSRPSQKPPRVRKEPPKPPPPGLNPDVTYETD